MWQRIASWFGLNPAPFSGGRTPLKWQPLPATNYPASHLIWILYLGELKLGRFRIFTANLRSLRWRTLLQSNSPARICPLDLERIQIASGRTKQVAKISHQYRRSPTARETGLQRRRRYLRESRNFLTPDLRSKYPDRPGLVSTRKSVQLARPRQGT